MPAMMDSVGQWVFVVEMVRMCVLAMKKVLLNQAQEEGCMLGERGS
jgi:hypothetical protein